MIWSLLRNASNLENKFSKSSEMHSTSTPHFWGGGGGGVKLENVPYLLIQFEAFTFTIILYTITANKINFNTLLCTCTSVCVCVLVTVRY